jgi:3-oxo-5-alpha-steroid 4-dehydrogenase 1
MQLFISLSYRQFEYFQFAWIAVAFLVFILLLKVTAPYGRHTTTGWGPLISNKWGWLLMELPVLIVLSIFVLPVRNTLAIASWIMIGLFVFHYFNRVFIFPFRIHTKGKKMPLIIMLSAVFFNIMNGFSFGYYFSHFAVYSNEWLTNIRFIVGAILFFTGTYINWRADNILIHLRKPGETHYIIPKGWLFDKISCPNLFGELIEWLGFAILCWSIPGLTFFIWTAANLIPRALSHHKWYKEKFSDYPTGRKAVLPFLV